MLIHSLTLENVKSFAQGTVEFSPGTNAIVGHNGSGKTTILEAIGFALFDHLPYNRADFVREGQRSARVTVDFLSDHDERVYQVIRRCGGSNDYTVFDPELSMKLYEGRADVIQFLREHLGINAETDPADLFSNAVGVPQGNFTASFLMPPRARKAVFEPLLKVAEYRLAFERLLEPLNLLKQRKNEQALEISRLEEKLTRLPTVMAEASDLSGRITNTETELRAAQTELATAEADREVMAAKRERLLDLQNLARIQKQAVAEQERTLAAARQRLTESEEAVATTDANRVGHEAYRAAQRDQRAVNERMAQRQQLQDERIVVQTRLTQAETQEDAHRRALADIAEAEQTAAELADAADEQKKLEADLRVAQRQADRLQDADARAQREQAAVDAALERLERLHADVAQAQKIEASLGPLQARVETLQKTMSAAQARVDQLHAQKGTIEEQGQRLKASETSAICPICEQPLSAVHRQQLIDRLRTQWKELNKDAADAAEAISQAESEREQARSTLVQREQTLRALPRQNAIETAEKELAELHGQLKATGAAAKALAHAPQRVKELQRMLDALGDPRRRRDVALQQARGRTRVEEALRQQRAQAEQHRSALAALDERMAAFATVEAESARINFQLEKFQAADDLYRRNQDAAEALPLRRQEVAEAEKALQAAQERYESGQAQLADSTREFDEERFEEAVARVNESRDLSVRLETELGLLREGLIRAEEEIAQLKTQEQRFAAAQSRHERLTEQEELLRFLRLVLQEAGPFVTRALVQQISHAANQLFGQIMEDYTHTLQWHEDYAIILEVDGRKRAFTQLSGGEQMSAALAVRLAMLQEMSDIAVAFFDEPTTNLDDARRDALARQIVGVRGLQQLFIISHDDSFEQATEKLIRVEKRDGASKILYA